MTDNNTNTSTIYSRKAVLADGFDFPAAVKEVRSANETLGKEAQNTAWNAALLLGGAKSRNLIGSKDGAIYPTQANFAATLGYSESYGSMLARLSEAQNLGLQRTNKEWSFLVQDATKGRVSSVIKEAKTLKDLKSGLAPLMSEKAQTGKVASKKAAPGEGAQQTAAEKAAVVVPPVPTVKDVLVTLHAQLPAIHGFTPEQWTEVRDALVKMVDAEDHRRDLLAKKAAREAVKNGKAVTPAMMPKTKTA